jgi:hypothetical protein
VIAPRWPAAVGWLGLPIQTTWRRRPTCWWRPRRWATSCSELTQSSLKGPCEHTTRHNRVSSHVSRTSGRGCGPCRRHGRGAAHTHGHGIYTAHARARPPRRRRGARQRKRARLRSWRSSVRGAGGEAGEVNKVHNTTISDAAQLWALVLVRSVRRPNLQRRRIPTSWTHTAPTSPPPSPTPSYRTQRGWVLGVGFPRRGAAPG